MSELIVYIMAIGSISILNILAYKLFDSMSRDNWKKVIYIIQELAKLNDQQHKMTRKETQEIKTRLTQVRKDLNEIERKVSK